MINLKWVLQEIIDDQSHDNIALKMSIIEEEVGNLFFEIRECEGPFKAEIYFDNLQEIYEFLVNLSGNLKIWLPENILKLMENLRDVNIAYDRFFLFYGIKNGLSLIDLARISKDSDKDEIRDYIIFGLESLKRRIYEMLWLIKRSKNIDGTDVYFEKLKIYYLKIQQLVYKYNMPIDCALSLFLYEYGLIDNGGSKDVLFEMLKNDKYFLD